MKPLQEITRYLMIVFVPGCLFCCQGAPVSNNSNNKAQFVELLADSAKLHFDRGDAGLALSYYKRALKHAQTQKLPQHQAKMLLRIAATLPRQDVDSSLNYLDSALRIAKTIHHYQLQSEIYHSIVQIHKQHHSYTAALFALEAHDKLTDSLLNERRTKEIQHLQVQKNAAQERAYYIIVAFILSGIVGFLAFFFRRTHKLNGQLAHAVAVRNKLFSIISHDLRGPAASLNQGHALIGTGAISVEELPEFLNMLENQSKTLNETLDSLLMWSRTQLDEIHARPAVFPLINCLNINIELLKGQYTAKELKIQLNVPAGMEIFADRDQFDFIIRNLLSNAIKFSYTKGTILVSAAYKKDSVLISVTDHGIGISAQRQVQFQAGTLETTYGTSGEKGTGLGLRMIKDFVASSGGKIHLKSTDGETRFYFNVPRPMY